MKTLINHADEVPLSKGFASVLATIMVATAMFGAPLVAQNTVMEAQAPIELGNSEAEILWFARAVYSETKIADEQVLVAWVIRNRVESERYPDSYKEVVLDPNQFSGLSPRDENYGLNISRSYTSQGLGWETALSAAEGVYYSDGVLRPIGSNVYHFYSPMAVRNIPEWAVGENPERTVRDMKNGYTRFAFYADIR